MAASVNLRPQHPRRNAECPRSAVRLIYRREGWELTTAPKYVRFATLAEVEAYLRAMRARRSSAIYARLEERVGHRWREIPLEEVAR
jgi:hypothetical protein